MHRNIKGFTLIEMAVVLVIIGLIVSGILIGQTMIRQTQVQSVLTDVSNYIQAVKNFKQKYNEMPGDMADATNYWGVASGGCPTGVRTGTQTCNGNGDGKVFNLQQNSTTGWPLTDIYEAYLVWQHLANAGMINGAYTGVPGPGGVWDATVSGAVPASQLTGGWYWFEYLGVYGDANNFTNNYGHVIQFGSPHPNWTPGNGVLTTQEGLSVDTKIDDGLPGTGVVVTQTKDSAFAGNCATTDDPTTAQYAVTVKGNVCAFYFKTGF